MTVDVDLYIHSTESDGESSTLNIVKIVLEKQLKVFSVTDYDRVLHVKKIEK